MDLFAIFERWAGARQLGEVATALSDHGCCWGQYRDFLSMVSDDPRCSIENPMFAQVDQPGVGPILSAGSPLRFGAIEAAEVPTAPVLGEHTEYVLAEVLGLADGEIGDLHDAGVVAGPSATG